VLERSEGFGARAPLRLLQMPVAHGIVRILAHRESGLEGRPLREFASKTVTVLGVAREDGTFVSLPDLSEEVRLADEIFVYGPDDEIDALHEVSQNGQRS
jgi:Trk K+ transport system NAD-binding subunit